MKCQLRLSEDENQDFEMPENYTLEYFARSDNKFFVIFAPTPSAGEDFTGDEGYEGQREYKGNGGYYHNFKVFIGNKAEGFELAGLRESVSRDRDGGATTIRYSYRDKKGTFFSKVAFVELEK